MPILDARPTGEGFIYYTVVSPLKNLKYRKNYQNVRQRSEVNSSVGAGRVAGYVAVRNLQFVEAAPSAKYNAKCSKRRAYTAILCRMQKYLKKMLLLEM